MAKCKECGQTIAFKETTTGSKMPVDPDLVNIDDVDEGQRILTEEGHIIKAGTHSYGQEAEGFLIHFDSCPENK